MPRQASHKAPHVSLPDDLTHGGLKRPAVTINGYSLELHDGDGFVGDSVSRVAYSEMLDIWRKENAIDGRYVWLPVEWEGGKPVVRWRDQWTLADLDKLPCDGPGSRGDK